MYVHDTYEYNQTNLSCFARSNQNDDNVEHIPSCFDSERECPLYRHRTMTNFPGPLAEILEECVALTPRHV